MQRVGDNYRKLRNTLRFLLGNIHDFDPATNAVAFADQEPLDQYILARTAELDAKIRKAYDDFEFHRAYHALNEFVNTDLSSLYLDVLKDRLYTFAPNHPARRSGQTALWRIAETLTRLIAPILSFTAEEVWALLPKVEGREASVHLALFPNMADIIPGDESGIEKDWEQLLEIRGFVMKGLEEKRARKEIGKALECILALSARTDILKNPFAVLDRYRSSLEEFFGVSKVELSPSTNTSPVVAPLTFQFIDSSAIGFTKCERCWRITGDVGHDLRYPTVCLRCADALQAIDFAPYTAPTEPAA